MQWDQLGKRETEDPWGYLARMDCLVLREHLAWSDLRVQGVMMDRMGREEILEFPE